MKKHGHRSARGGKQSYAYISWRCMKQRCDNPRNDSYENYGGRGISYIKRWENFAEFLKDMGPRKRGQSIDRINVNGSYSPENCKWSTRRQQDANKRDIHVEGW